jgi:7-cyano-7-deazaguanine reductase
MTTKKEKLMTTKKVTKKRVAKNSITTLDNSYVSKHLGKKSVYKSTYDPKLLVAEPRQNNRTYLDIETTLPFIGYDVWNGYEVSALTNTGKPICGIAKVIYFCDNKFIVESKSMKLYWNSFNMTTMGKDRYEVFNNLEETASKDLSKLLKTDVIVKLFDTTPIDKLNQHSIYYKHHPTGIIAKNLELNCSDNLKYTVYNEDPTLLNIIYDNNVIQRYYHSALLKSNCRVTGAPDWGDVFIYIKGNDIPTDESLLEYIVSFRGENHFHEEICECLYKRLWDRCNPEELAVTCLYVRRGGWDINPHRCSHEHLMNIPLMDSDEMFIKLSRQ